MTTVSRVPFRSSRKKPSIRLARATGEAPASSSTWHARISRALPYRVKSVWLHRIGWQSFDESWQVIESTRCGPLAQLVEQQTLNLRVWGSSPRRLTIFTRKIATFASGSLVLPIVLPIGTAADERRWTPVDRSRLSPPHLSSQDHVQFGGRLLLQGRHDVRVGVERKDSDRYKVAKCIQAEPVFCAFGRSAHSKVISVSVLRLIWE